MQVVMHKKKSSDNEDYVVLFFCAVFGIMLLLQSDKTELLSGGLLI
jgi:hypothetical protein